MKKGESVGEKKGWGGRVCSWGMLLLQYKVKLPMEWLELLAEGS